VRGTKLTKYYFAGGLRIAERVTTAPTYLASVPKESPAVRLAEGSGGEMVLTLRQDWGPIAAGMACVAVLGLLAVPGRRRAVVGITVRRGQVLVVLVAWTLNVVPVPWKVRTGDPHLEIGLGTGEALGQTVEVNHYHLDRLGSTVLVTDQAGNPRECVRYRPYGEVRGRFACPGTSQLTEVEQEPEFTGYETDATSGLQYAGARYYDPVLGTFLTHDPMREFPNPYTYVHWDPVNATDPSGACEGICIVGIVIAVAAVVATGIDAAVRSGDALTGLKASATTLAYGSAPVGMSYGLNLIAPKTFGAADPRAHAIALVPVVGSAYGAAQSFKAGNYATGVVAALATAYSIYSLSQWANGASGRTGGDEVLRGSGGDIVIDRESPFAGYDGEVTLIGGQTPANPDNLSGLKPVFREMVELTMIELEQQGWSPRVAEGLRTPAQQAAKVAAKTSTTLNSAHLKGYAADIIDSRWGWGGPAAKHSFRYWHELGAVAQRQGLTWGGHWKTFPDPAHVQMPNWRTLP
jgi:RHS repeat-associated protein